MAKDLFGGSTIEVPCRICGKMFPEYESHAAQLYCGRECRHIAHNRARREKWQARRDQRFEATMEYLQTVLETISVAPSVNVLDSSSDLFGTPRVKFETRKERRARRKAARPERQRQIALRHEYRLERHSWSAMRNRVLNESQEWYHRYGGRGITICERWLNSFENFVTDMGRKPGPEYSLERLNNDGNYEPGNCKWATASEQAKNSNRPKTYKKRQKVTIERDLFK